MLLSLSLVCLGVFIYVSIQEVAFFDKDLNASGSLTATVATYGANASGVLGLIWLEIFACIIKYVILGGLSLLLRLTSGQQPCRRRRSCLRL